MNTSASNFSISEIGQLINIANRLGVDIPESKSASVELYLDSILKKIEEIPYVPFPIAFHTVDIVVFRGMDILLGKKPDKSYYQFIGGFVDPGETAVTAARRELYEESNIVIEDEKDYSYLGSFFINDPRYANSCHKITTSFFGTFITNGQDAFMMPKDDIQEVKWFSYDELNTAEKYKEIIGSLHIPLFEALDPWINYFARD